MTHSVAELRNALHRIPNVDVLTDVPAVDDSVQYLRSDDAIASVAADIYWPKWNAPWWHMLLLTELGLANRIPDRAVRAMVAGLQAYPLKFFPLRPDEWPPGYDRSRHSMCHCALGSIDRVLDACGVDVDADLPWIVPWYGRYQMADGGLNCDETAYSVAGECPSSMVGTIAPFEAMLRRGPGRFVEQAAAFLVRRDLVRGSDGHHNAEERDAAKKWFAPTFPRFYFYDVLRGVSALVRWSTIFGAVLPFSAVKTAVAHLVTTAPDGLVRVGRRAFEGHPTWAEDDAGKWVRVPLASQFSLLDALSQIGAPSAALTAEWTRTRRELLALIDAGRVL
jgi:hypothetical protein